jgi:hypothetical protein
MVNQFSVVDTPPDDGEYVEVIETLAGQYRVRVWARLSDAMTVSTPKGEYHSTDAASDRAMAVAQDERLPLLKTVQRQRELQQV